MGIVSNRDNAEREEDESSSGQPIDFDPDDPDVVKVIYDLRAWSFDQRAELSEILAERGIAHVWIGDELVAPEELEAALDELFEELEARLGPFPILLDDDVEVTEFGLEEWTEADRAVLTESLIAAEVPHRWEASTVVVPRDAEHAVDELLDAIEAGELLSADDDVASEPPDGILNTLFGVADELARDPLDLRARNQVLDLDGTLDPRHPPYAFAPRTWASALALLGTMAASLRGDGVEGIGVDEEDEGGLVHQADALRNLLRPYV